MHSKNISEWHETLICITYLSLKKFFSYMKSLVQMVKARGPLIRIYNFTLKYNDKKNLIFFTKASKPKTTVITFYNFKRARHIKCLNKVAFIESNSAPKSTNSSVCKIDIESN